MFCAVLLDKEDPEFDCAIDLLTSLRKLWRLDAGVTPLLEVVRGGSPFGSSCGSNQFRCSLGLRRSLVSLEPVLC